MKKLLAIIIAGLAVTSAFTHSGGTDSQGCHHDRKRGGTTAIDGSSLA